MSTHQGQESDQDITNHTKPIRIHIQGMCQIMDMEGNMLLTKCYLGLWAFCRDFTLETVHWFLSNDSSHLLIVRLKPSVSCVIVFPGLWRASTCRKRPLLPEMLCFLFPWFFSSKAYSVVQLFLHVKRILLSCIWVPRQKMYFLICGYTKNCLGPISSSWQIKKWSEVNAKHANKTTENRLS